jgi:hypothetical protein
MEPAAGCRSRVRSAPGAARPGNTPVGVGVQVPVIRIDRSYEAQGEKSSRRMSRRLLACSGKSRRGTAKADLDEVSIVGGSAVMRGSAGGRAGACRCEFARSPRLAAYLSRRRERFA